MGEDTAVVTDQLEEKPKKGRFGINRNLIMLKLTLFFLYGATSSLVPYLTIHMQSIGLTMEEIGIIYLALPFTTFLAPPLTGFLMDKFGRYKPVVIAAFLLTAIVHHSLILIPHQETPGVTPSAYILTHPKKLYVEVWWSPCPSKECPESEDLDMVLDLCVDHCLLKNKTQKQPMNQTIMGIDLNQDDNLSFHIKKTRNLTLYKNDSLKEFTLDMHSNLGDPIEQFGIDIESAEDDEDIMDFKKRFKERLLKRFGVNVTELESNDLRCGGIVQAANSTTKKLLTNYSDDCIVQKCHFISGGPGMCPPEYKKSGDSIFWTYFALRFVATVMMTAGVTIMDPIALAMIEKYGGDFGKERLFSSLGMAIFSPITGLFIDYKSEQQGFTDYSAAFYTFDALLIVASITVFMLPLGTKLPADNLFRDLLNIFKMPHLVMFILFLFILGNLWGFIECFLFFYLRDLGAPNYLLGITVTVGTVSSLPFLYGAENITKKIGHVNVIIVAFFAHAARLFGYSVIESAWWCFPFEAMESLSVHLMWVAAATFCAVIAPKGLLATLIGVVGMAHFSIGRGCGSFFGSNLVASVGIRQSFRLMAMLALGSGGCYAVIHYLWLRKTQEKAEAIVVDAEAVILKPDEPKFKDQATMVSFERLSQERLSLVVEYNQIGSLTSLGRFKSDIIRTRSNSIRRGSLLKSAIEVNIAKNMQNSANYLNGHTANSSGKLYPDLKYASSAPKLPERSASLANADRELIKLLPKSESKEEQKSNQEKLVESEEAESAPNPPNRNT